MNKDQINEKKSDVIYNYGPIAKKKKNSVMGINKIVIQTENLQSDYKDFKEVRSLDATRKRREAKEVFKSGV